MLLKRCRDLVVILGLSTSSPNVPVNTPFASRSCRDLADVDKCARGRNLSEVYFDLL